MVRDANVYVQRAAAVLLVLGGAYAALLAPQFWPGYSYRPLIDGWLNFIVDGCVIAVLTLRAWTDRRERLPWALLAGGLILAMVSSLSYYAYYQFLDEIPSPSAADGGWIAFYVLLYAGLVLLLRARVPSLLRSLWLDGLVAGLTGAAVAAAVFGGTAPYAPEQTAGWTVIYPVADLILFGLSIAAIAMLGWAAGAMWWLLCASFMAFAVTDAIYAALVVDGAYTVGHPVDLGWLLARLGLAAAAWTSARASYRERPMSLGGTRVLAIPIVCGLAVLGLLFYGSQNRLSLLAGALAVGAGIAVLARTLLTFGEVRQLAEARRQARTDELTGLANRRHFYDALERTCAAVQRKPCAVILIDLNRFKEVNDSFGHQVGDQVLVLVSQRLARFQRGDDVVARLGGDEYALLLHEPSEDAVLAKAQRVREVLQSPISLGAATVTVDASVGIARAPQHSSTPDGLVAMADLAMFSAKAERLGVAVYDASRNSADLNRLERVRMLRDGIRNGELELHYQPQVDLTTGETTGVEALVRWRHPQDGLLYPQVFIGLAESAGLMTELTMAVLDAALRQRQRWQAGGVPLRMAVNVSPSVLVDGEFPAQVVSLLAGHGVDGEAVTLELTEELLMDNRERGVVALRQLRDAGVCVAIDDYGTGYSSLAYLKDLPVNELKLDRSFVADLTASSQSATIVQSTVDLAHALGLKIVAEGVEDVATLQSLRDAGCDVVQGFLLGRPVPPEGVPGAVLHAASQAQRGSGDRGHV